MAFECGICASMFNATSRQPLILECGHSFCRPCIAHNLGPQHCCPYCRQPIRKHVDELPRNYALENAMEAANVPLIELMDRWGISHAERMMVRPEQLELSSLISRKGNSGEVWRGRLWGKDVAVKLMPLSGVDDRQLNCLRREIAVLLHTTGECKQVCLYKGFCIKDGHLAIIMKLYSCSLASRVAGHPARRLPLPRALKYARDIAKGLVELHRLGVVAADVKPDNVLLDDDLGDAVLADFGISVVVTTLTTASWRCGSGGGGVGGNNTAATLARSSGCLLGTPHYMAPEQFAPGQRPTNKVDIWGWAATLLHMLTGSPPWARDGLLQICTAVGVAKRAPPLPAGLPGPLEDLLAACFQPEPARRPTACQVLQALASSHMERPLLRPNKVQDEAVLGIQRHNSRMLAAARGVLLGLQKDCCHLVNHLAEDHEQQQQQALLAALVRGLGPEVAAPGCGVAALRPVAEEDTTRGRSAGSSSGTAAAIGTSRRMLGQPPTAAALGGVSDDRQGRAVDQGLLGVVLGVQPAPPMAGESSSTSSTAGAPSAPLLPGCGVVSSSGSISGGGVGCGSSGMMSSAMLPQVLWSEDEALEEVAQQQQQQQQMQGAAAGDTAIIQAAGSMHQLQPRPGNASSHVQATTPPRAGNHLHARSASDMPPQLVAQNADAAAGGALVHDRDVSGARAATALAGWRQQASHASGTASCTLLGSTPGATARNGAAHAWAPPAHKRSVSDAVLAWNARSKESSAVATAAVAATPALLPASGGSSGRDSSSGSGSSSSCGASAGALLGGCGLQQQHSHPKHEGGSNSAAQHIPPTSAMSRCSRGGGDGQKTVMRADDTPAEASCPARQRKQWSIPSSTAASRKQQQQQQQAPSSAPPSPLQQNKLAVQQQELARRQALMAARKQLDLARALSVAKPAAAAAAAAATQQTMMSPGVDARASDNGAAATAADTITAGNTAECGSAAGNAVTGSLATASLGLKGAEAKTAAAAAAVGPLTAASSGSAAAVAAAAAATRSRGPGCITPRSCTASPVPAATVAPVRCGPLAGGGATATGAAAAVAACVPPASPRLTCAAQQHRTLGSLLLGRSPAGGLAASGRHVHAMSPAPGASVLAQATLMMPLADAADAPQQKSSGRWRSLFGGSGVGVRSASRPASPALPPLSSDSGCGVMPGSPTRSAS